MSSENKSTSSWIVEDFARLTQERDEALATIEALRRRVAELERERDRWKSAHHEMVDRNKLLRDRPDLPIERLQAYKQITAENAELKRQVVALREDAEVGRDAIEAMAIMDTLRRIDEGWSVEILNDNPDPETKDVQCGVVVHSDFGMTQDQYLGETVLDALRKALKSTVEALREAAKKGEVEG